MWHIGHFPHALLLTGAEGTGGLPMALALAQYIFCENKHENDSCGTCASCHKTSKLEHADLHLSFPTISPKPGTKAMSVHFINEFRDFVKHSAYGNTFDWLQFIDADNKQGNLTAEECREIIDQLNLKSYEGGKKVQLIWRPEYLGKEGNILLKLIEEPPADTIILLVAENTEEILPTILSRVQTIRLPPIPATDIAHALQHKKVEAKKAMQIAHIANGNYSEALRLIQHTQNDLFPEVKTWFNALFTGNGIAISKFAEEWSKAGREQQKNFLQYVIRLLEEAIRLRYQRDTEAALPEEEAQFAQKLSGMHISFEMLGQMVSVLSDTIFYIERNAHSKTQLHALSIRLQYIITNKELTL